jgi:RHS repeat-associated protein
VTKNTTYHYDERDNRLGEVNGHILLPPGLTLPTETWYIRDAQGNVLSVYTKNTAGQLVQTELPLYGSSRLGMLKVTRLGPWNSALTPKPIRQIPFQRRRGDKFFEISNHLGNVITTVSDQMLGEGTTALTYYQAQVKTHADYYPFGMEMEGRTASSLNYRYGFNGKEKDASGEFSASQTHYDYGFRIYNPVWGKFLSVDPLTGSYSMLTPYQFASNSPISGIDLDGLEYYYAADGSYLGKSGTSLEIRIITNKEVEDVARTNLASQKNDHTWLLKHSQQGFTDADQAALDWSFENRGRTQAAGLHHSRPYEEVQVEFGAVIGSLETTDHNSKLITLFTLGTTVPGIHGSVDLDESRTLEGWKRQHGIHSHPGDDGNQEDFSSRETNLGFSGDKEYAEGKGYSLFYLLTPKGTLKSYNTSQQKTRDVYSGIPTSFKITPIKFLGKDSLEFTAYFLEYKRFLTPDLKPKESSKPEEH